VKTPTFNLRVEKTMRTMVSEIEVGCRAGNGKG